jgi:hypothetical protein
MLPWRPCGSEMAPGEPLRGGTPWQAPSRHQRRPAGHRVGGLQLKSHTQRSHQPRAIICYARMHARCCTSLSAGMTSAACGQRCKRTRAASPTFWSATSRTTGGRTSTWSCQKRYLAGFELRAREFRKKEKHGEWNGFEMASHLFLGVGFEGGSKRGVGEIGRRVT